MTAMWHCGAYRNSGNISVMNSVYSEGASSAQGLNANLHAKHESSTDETTAKIIGDLEPNDTADQLSENDIIIPKHKSGHKKNSTAETASREQGRDGIPGLALVLAGGALAASVYLFKKFFSSDLSDEPSEAVINQLFLVNLNLNTPSVAAAATAAPRPTLTEKKLVVSDRIDIQGIKTRFGSSEWQSLKKPCTVSAPIVDQLIQAGAVIIGTLPTWPLGLNPSFSSPENSLEKHKSRTAREITAIPNPSAPKEHTHGGGEYGPAVAIAAGAADLCIAVDEVGSALIPAACCGVYAYRPTSGVLQLEGAAIASSTLGTTCLLASDPALIIRAAQALNVPGGGNDVAGIVSKYLVAEDLFALCDEQVKNSAPAVVAAVKRWAGPEHAQGLSLCDWLYHRIPSLTEFMPGSSMHTNNQNPDSSNANSSEDSTTSSSSSVKRTADVLSALTAAASAIRKWEWLRSPSGRWASTKHRHATSAVSSIASGISENDTSRGTAVLPPEIVAGFLDAHLVSEKLYLSAIAVADELSQGMRGALQEGYVFVVPTTPGPAPKNWGKFEEKFRKLSEQFAALASLAGVPQIVMPMPSPDGIAKNKKHRNGEKKAPLSISMVTLQRRDLMLVKAAAKLGPMLKEEAEKLSLINSASSGTSSTYGRAKQKLGDNVGSGIIGGGGNAPSGSKKKGSTGISDEHTRAGEAAKEEGNIAFKAGRYSEAVKRYSEAVQYNPHAAVYFSNRAMAYLKLGRYTAAEADCDAALEIDPSMVKALLRRGSAQLAQGRLVEARSDFERVLYLEPRNKQAIEELKRLKNIEAPDSNIDF